jgi:Lrp/AsnC family leucine-responsive transcriptional regulator
MADLDRADRLILRQVQEDAERTSEAIAEAVALSPSAVQRRIQRLKKDGVIQKVVALVDPRAVGRTVTVVVEIEVDNERRPALAGFYKWVALQPEIQCTWGVTGDIDYVMLVVVRDLDAYAAFIDRMMEEQPLIRRYKSRVAIKTIKRGLVVETE